MAQTLGGRSNDADVAVSPPPGASSRTAGAGRRGGLVISSAVAAVGVGLGVIVVRDGSPGWRVVRLLVVAAVVTVAGKAVRGRHAARRVGAALALSLVAVPVGLGVGGPHLVKSGPPILTVAGLAALAGGVVLVVTAIIGLAPGASRWRRLPARAAVVVALAVSCWTLGPAVAATNVPRTGLGSQTPADVGVAYRDVEFPAADGVRLSGWYLPSGNGAAVVLLHGAGSTRSSVLDHAGVLARNGYGVLLFDARGHGRSDGRAMDFGWFGDRDVGGAVSFLERQADVDPRRIGAVGLSMGGEEAIGAAAAVDGIRVVVAEGATNRVAGDKAWLSDEFGARGALSEVVGSLTYVFADLLTSAGPPITLHAAVQAAARPTLLIAAGDVADESRAARYIQSASPDTVALWIVPDTGHTDALATHPAEWEATVVAFLRDAIGPDGAAAP